MNWSPITFPRLCSTIGQFEEDRRLPHLGLSAGPICAPHFTPVLGPTVSCPLNPYIGTTLLFCGQANCGLEHWKAKGQNCCELCVGKPTYGLCGISLGFPCPLNPTVHPLLLIVAFHGHGMRWSSNLGSETYMFRMYLTQNCDLSNFIVIFWKD